MTIRSTSTLETLQALIAQQLGLSPEAIQPETVLEEIDLDSLMRIDLAVSLEKHFQRTFEEQVAIKWKTVQDIIDTVGHA